MRQVALAARLGAVGAVLLTPVAAIACTGDWARHEPVQIARLDERMDVVLDDGRLIRLAGLAALPADAVGGQALAPARQVLEAQMREGLWLLQPLSAQPDRWNRLAAILLPPPESTAKEPLNARLAAAGLARLGDLQDAGSCAPILRRAEDGARSAGLGLWADPYYAVRDAAQTRALEELAGQFAVVEGRIRRVGRGRQRLYLDFGPTRQDFSVIVAMRTLRLLERQNIRPEALRGRRVRVRGWLDMAEGPRLDLAGPGYIDLLPEGR